MKSSYITLSILLSALRRFDHWPLHRRLIASSLIGAIPLFVLCAVLWFVDCRTQRHLTLEQNVARARVAAAYVQEWLEGNVQVLHAVNTDIAAQHYSLAAVKRIFAEQSAIHQDWENIAFADENGHVIAAKLLVLPYVGDRPYFKQAKRTRHASCSNAVRSRVTGHRVVVIAYPIVNRGRFAGVIYISIRPSKIQQVFSKNSTGTSNRISLWGADRRLIARASTTHPLPDITNLPMRKHALQRVSGTLILPNPSGSDQLLTGYARVQNSGWVIFSSTPSAESPLPFEENGIIAVGVMVLFVIFSILWAYHGSGIMTRKIRMLAEYARYIGEGDLSVRVPVTRDKIFDLPQSLNKMAASLEKNEQQKSDLISMISHELKTPLTSIRTSLELICERIITPDHPRYADLLRITDRQSRRLDFLVENLLFISRHNDDPATIVPQCLSLCDYVPDIMRNWQPLAQERQLVLSVTIPQNIDVSADPAAIMLVLNNLIDNAIKYTDEGTVTVTAIRHGNEAIVSVADTGIGIPDDLKERIFEQFFQAEPLMTRKAGGSGLGLYVTKMLVEAHGGHVFAKPNEGASGSIFGFTLPLWKAEK